MADDDTADGECQSRADGEHHWDCIDGSDLVVDKKQHKHTGVVRKERHKALHCLALFLFRFHMLDHVTPGRVDVEVEEEPSKGEREFEGRNWVVGRQVDRGEVEREDLNFPELGAHERRDEEQHHEQQNALHGAGTLTQKQCVRVELFPRGEIEIHEGCELRKVHHPASAQACDRREDQHRHGGIDGVDTVVE
ncbi:hypothetical protein OGAPHI_002529 [Ogataea philodendri]|uniref:Uncharacterized protein n=1 Tax=Ogataea philodendri TaxID=1378263 RepID=A0A9P8PCK0_9ASCO|nr:uncharacterized protein OGAPHI_002529 [Ogataea philodendri]KAH3668774.1 hypothetical protein OGAPHI_002529 [Ogataea philodendri]